MEMTIEESIKVLQEVPKVMPITKESINVALETMRKYQKIEDIYYHQSGEALENSLRTVIEDGNDD